MSTLGIYFIFKLDNLIEFFSFIAIVFFVASVSFIVSYFYMKLEENETTINFKKLSIISTIILVLSTLMAFALPTTNEAASIYLYKSISENKELQKIPPKLIDLANSWLNKLKPKND